MELYIYDRWGKQVFSTNDPKSGWDGFSGGEKLSSAVFSYFLKARLYSGSEIIKKGNLSLVR